MAFCSCAEKSVAAVKSLQPGPALSSAPESTSAAPRSSRPSQKKSCAVNFPSPRTKSLTPAALASRSEGLPGLGLVTPTSEAAEAGTAVACSRACRGETSSPPASTMTRIRETVQGSCSDESTSGKGNETPSSGSMSHAPSAPSTSITWLPGDLATSSPTSTGSSRSWCRRSITRSAFSAATTRTMPKPQLKVEASSLERILPTAASHLKTAGSSHASERRCAARCGGSTSSKQRSRPPLATCAAPRSSPALASASTGLT
mmetsp:Transcript_56347/g.159939  ORF Transcript_56347/g.159939 Transcript_56347/m.159939 type:complete len:260 (+) Transcript_56347:562-1341(+)